MSLTIKQLKTKISAKDKIKNYNKIFEKIKESNTNFKMGFELELYLKEDTELFKINEEFKKIIYSDLFFDCEQTIDDSTNNYENWIITKDDSLNKYTQYNGIEIISPMLGENEFDFYLIHTLKLLNKINIETKDNCGLHIHISNESFDKNIDPVKFMLFAKKMGLFKDWKSRPFVKNMEKVFNNYSPDDFNKNIDRMGKYWQINFNLNDPDNHIELRMIGGENYHNKLKDIYQSLNNFKYIYTLATNPDMKKDIYMEMLFEYSSRDDFKEMLNLNDVLHKVGFDMELFEEFKLKKLNKGIVINYDEDNEIIF